MQEAFAACRNKTKLIKDESANGRVSGVFRNGDAVLSGKIANVQGGIEDDGAVGKRERLFDEAGHASADRVARMNVETGEWNFYLLPFEANIRDINLQPPTRDGLSGLWIGHTHQAMITLVEPLAR